MIHRRPRDRHKIFVVWTSLYVRANIPYLTKAALEAFGLGLEFCRMGSTSLPSESTNTNYRTSKTLYNNDKPPFFLMMHYATSFSRMVQGYAQPTRDLASSNRLGTRHTPWDKDTSPSLTPRYTSKGRRWQHIESASREGQRILRANSTLISDRPPRTVSITKASNSTRAAHITPLLLNKFDDKALVAQRQTNAAQAWDICVQHRDILCFGPGYKPTLGHS
ncbi:hypothetical protein H4582DRAFT_1399047 [Lactarius indigo]|nr:hypothetical protein H4582DRAFT_1399047 [Lactarius indigo]